MLLQCAEVKRLSNAMRVYVCEHATQSLRLTLWSPSWFILHLVQKNMCALTYTHTCVRMHAASPLALIQREHNCYRQACSCTPTIALTHKQRSQTAVNGRFVRLFIIHWPITVRPRMKPLPNSLTPHERRRCKHNQPTDPPLMFFCFSHLSDVNNKGLGEFKYSRNSQEVLQDDFFFKVVFVMKMFFFLKGFPGITFEIFVQWYALCRLIFCLYLCNRDQTRTF